MYLIWFYISEIDVVSEFPGPLPQQAPPPQQAPSQHQPAPKPQHYVHVSMMTYDNACYTVFINHLLYCIKKHT